MKNSDLKSTTFSLEISLKAEDKHSREDGSKLDKHNVISCKMFKCNMSKPKTQQKPTKTLTKNCPPQQQEVKF